MYIDQLLNVNTYKLYYNPINWDTINDLFLISIHQTHNELYKKALDKESKTNNISSINEIQNE